jgi:hypothetical protein
MESKAMGSTVNFEDSKLLRGPMDRAKAKGRNIGKAELIERLLEKKFPGEVPANLADHMADIEPHVLDEIFDRSMDAQSVAQALGAHIGSPLAIQGAGHGEAKLTDLNEFIKDHGVDIPGYTSLE